MDPDPEAEQAASQILKTAFISVVFTACHYHTKTTIPLHSSQKTVIIAAPPAVNKPHAAAVKKKKNIIYLTFDDGPNRGTRKVMHIAEEEKVPITMFIVGEHVYASAYQRQTWDSISACPMIEICNHSYSHAHNRYLDFYSEPDSVTSDFTRCADSLKFSNTICRAPGRNIWRTENVSSTDIKSSEAAADSLHKLGYELVGWDLEWHYDEKSLRLQTDADSLLRQIGIMFKSGRTKNAGHLVLLAHDQVYENTDDSAQLHSFISQLKNNDEYQLELVSKYPGIKN